MYVCMYVCMYVSTQWKQSDMCPDNTSKTYGSIVIIANRCHETCTNWLHLRKH